jgi:uncharacterized protein involved in exopolysaccharide biosynthesis
VTELGVVPREMSSLTLAAALLRGRRRIIGWAVLCGGLGAVLGQIRRPTFTASASFMPQAQSEAGSPLRTLAGQFGVSLGANGTAPLPEFYVFLVKSRIILSAVVADSVSLLDSTGTPVRRAVVDFFDVRAESHERRLELAVERLDPLIRADYNRRTGVISLSVKTIDRDLSLAIEHQLLSRINDFNLHTTQTQASAERRFAEDRTREARKALRDSEDALQAFMERNRQWERAPQLVLERERLQRDISLQQELVRSLSQSLEDARLREVRDTPVITIVQPPMASVVRDPRGRVMLALLGLAIGALLGCVLSAMAGIVRREQIARTAEAADFAAAVQETKRDPLGVRRRRRA